MIYLKNTDNFLNDVIGVPLNVVALHSLQPSVNCCFVLWTDSKEGRLFIEFCSLKTAERVIAWGVALTGHLD